MSRERVLELLEGVAAGSMSAEHALQKLAWLPTEDVKGNGNVSDRSAIGTEGEAPYARLDHHRALRVGFPEVVFCAGKTSAQVVEICRRLHANEGGFLATRATPETMDALESELADVQINRTARTAHIPFLPPDALSLGNVLILCAGTSDLPVAEEAAVTAQALGGTAERIYDVGVAGIHRLLDQSAALHTADVIIVAAGMEGALPSVVGGLVAAPVIAVPTSVGYGASFGGIAALLGMLNSCASGLTVVNIDNGFGAACAAIRILRTRRSA